MAQYAVDGWIEVDGSDERWPASRIEVSFTLNEIPRALVAVSLGRDIATGATSPAHDPALMAKLRYNTPVKIIAKVVPVSKQAAAISGEFGLDDSELVLFDGLVAGTSFNCSRDAAHMIVALNGWLEQLTWSSAINGGSHAGNPMFFTAGAMSSMLGGTGATPAFSLNTLADSVVNGFTVTTDFWGSAIKPWLISVCRQPMVMANVEAYGAAANDLAVEALDRITSPVPLKLELGTIAAEMGPAIAADFADSVGNLGAVCRGTVWDLIVGRFAEQYCFAVVPRPSTAYVVPFIPGYSGGGDVHARVAADHYHSIAFESANPKPIRGLGIVVPMASTTGAVVGETGGQPNNQTSVGPVYIPDMDASGAIALEYAPSWASTSLTPVGYGVYTAGLKGAAIGTAISPAVGVTPDGATPAEFAEFAGGAAKVLARLARARYANYVLQQRRVTLTGAFRLDIAPGSLLEVEVATDQHVADAVGMDKVSVGFYGQAMRVVLTLDSNAGEASTKLMLGNVRTYDEADDPKVTFDEHPLYEDAFLGAALID